ncbi:MAG: AbrB/MazE/SpoVT family DNA-binding domain-containing protein [Bacillota bacterium]
MTEAIRKIGKKAQVTLPKKMVNQLNINEGDRLLFQLKGDNIVITPVVTVPKDDQLTEQDLRDALEQAEREFKDGSAKIYEDAEQLFKETGWVDDDNS